MKKTIWVLHAGRFVVWRFFPHNFPLFKLYYKFLVINNQYRLIEYNNKLQGFIIQVEKYLKAERLPKALIRVRYIFLTMPWYNDLSWILKILIYHNVVIWDAIFEMCLSSVRIIRPTIWTLNLSWTTCDLHRCMHARALSEPLL